MIAACEKYLLEIIKKEHLGPDLLTSCSTTRPSFDILKVHLHTWYSHTATGMDNFFFVSLHIVHVSCSTHISGLYGGTVCNIIKRLISAAFGRMLFFTEVNSLHLCK